MDNMFNEPHSLAIRIWHWLFFLVLTASLVTVLFASTLFRTRNTIGLVQDQLQHKGLVVSKDQARDGRKHYIRVKTTYLIFYVLILTMALTGLGLHLVGVIRADGTRHKGLVSGMIHGEKQQ